MDIAVRFPWLCRRDWESLRQFLNILHERKFYYFDYKMYLISCMNILHGPKFYYFSCKVYLIRVPLSFVCSYHRERSWIYPLFEPTLVCKSTSRRPRLLPWWYLPTSSLLLSIKRRIEKKKTCGGTEAASEEGNIEQSRKKGLENESNKEKNSSSSSKLHSPWNYRLGGDWTLRWWRGRNPRDLHTGGNIHQCRFRKKAKRRNTCMGLALVREVVVTTMFFFFRWR